MYIHRAGLEPNTSIVIVSGIIHCIILHFEFNHNIIYQTMDLSVHKIQLPAMIKHIIIYIYDRECVSLAVIHGVNSIAIMARDFSDVTYSYRCSNTYIITCMCNCTAHTLIAYYTLKLNT